MTVLSGSSAGKMIKNEVRMAAMLIGAAPIGPGRPVELVSPRPAGHRSSLRRKVSLRRHRPRAPDPLRGGVARRHRRTEIVGVPAMELLPFATSNLPIG